MLAVRQLHSAAPLFKRESHEKSRTALFSDARLDNRAELASRLRCSSELTDSQLILQAYLRWGPDLCRHLLGDFAIVAVDQANGRVDLFRDHVGTRPLFYRRTANGIDFAATIEALLASAAPSPLDDTVVATEIMGGRRTLPGKTFYPSIERLPAGHHLSWRDGRYSITRWWNPFDKPQRDKRGFDDLLDEGRELLRSAVRARTTGESRLAFHVTGGLDSSAILALAAADRGISDLPPVGYGWQEPSDINEGPRVAAAISIMPMEFRAPQLDVAQVGDLWRQDWTVHPSQWNLIHELAIQRDAGQSGLRTILSGWGGDEAISFNGRGLHAELLRSFDLSGLANLSSRPGLSAFAASTKTALREMADTTGRRTAVATATFLSDEFVASVDLPPMRTMHTQSCRHAMQSLLELGTIPARVEDWAISGREYGLTYHYPLLDRNVMEFAYSLPGTAFRHGTTKRWLFREMMRGLLPEAIRTEQSKAEDSRTGRMIRLVQQSFIALADEVEDRRTTLRRAHYFDMDRLVSALRDPPGFGDSRLGHLRRAVQFLDL